MEKTYSITDFGACMCDRVQTAEIQAAIDTCFQNGGGTVLVPSGIFLTGGLRLRSHVTLYLESGACLKGSRDPEDYVSYLHDSLEPIKEYDYSGPRSAYPYSRWCNAVIRVIDAENVSVIGEKGSYIDGVNCYDETGEEGYRGPHGICVWNSKNITLEGYTFVDCGNWAHALFNTQNITARRLTVLGGHDGFDLRTCDNVLIEDSVFSSGDDCIAGFDNHNVIVRNCTLDSACSLFRFGGNNILIENCSSTAPSRFGHRWGLSDEKKKAGAPTDENCRHNTLTAFLYYCDFRAEIRKTPGDIVIRNCSFTNCDNLFSLEYDGEHVWCCNRSLSSIQFKNCVINGVSEPIYIWGDEKEPLDFTLKNTVVTARNGFEDIALLSARNFSKITFDEVKTVGFHDPKLLLFTEGEWEIKNSTDKIKLEKR